MTKVSNRHAKANNLFIPDYDTKKKNNYIVYLDCTNLYGTVITQHLPIYGFRGLQRNEIDALDVHEFHDDDDKGYIDEVGLQYPQYFHELHSDYPLAPEKRTVTENMLSPYSKRMKLLKISLAVATVTLKTYNIIRC